MSKHSTLIQWSEEDEAYVAVVPELPGLSAFGSSPEEAARELAIAKEAFLEVLVEDGEEIPKPEVLKPFSGQTRLRLPKSLHAALANQAKREDISLNTYIVQLLSQSHISQGLALIRARRMSTGSPHMDFRHSFSMLKPAAFKARAA